MPSGDPRFLSHLDLLRTLSELAELTFLCLTEGFHPKPKLSFAAPLAVGITSQGEYGDVFLREALSPQEFCSQLNRVLPKGLRIVRAVQVGEKVAPVMAVVNGAEYRVELGGDTIPAERVQQVMASDQLPVERTTKKGTRLVDVRPLISH